MVTPPMATPPKLPCYVCNKEATVQREGDQSFVSCDRCGEYFISGTLRMLLPWDKSEAYKLSGVLRHASVKGRAITLTTRNLEELIKTAPVPRNPLESIDEILKLVFDRTMEFGAEALIKQSRDYPLVYAKSPEEFNKFAFAAEKLNYIEVTPGISAILTLKGWERVAELQKLGPINSMVAFMATPFRNPELDRIYKENLQPSIKKTGFDLRRINEEQPAGLIDDQLRVGIQNSRFLLAELTAEDGKDNGGVYWEAGYAEGLGKPVIYLSRKNTGEEIKTHFDTNHHVTVFWNKDNLPQAMEELKATVRYTFPAEAKKTDDEG